MSKKDLLELLELLKRGIDLHGGTTGERCENWNKWYAEVEKALEDSKKEVLAC